MTIPKRVESLENTTDHLIALNTNVVTMLGEMREDNRMTRRIWIAIAKKQKLFDDDEWRDVFGDEDC